MLPLVSGRDAITATVVLILAGVVATAPAQAQSAAANATRRDLIEQATHARAAGNHTEAVELLRRAAEIRMTVSLRMLLAEEQSAVGQLTAALDNADTCTREVRTQDGVTDRDAVAARCTALVQALRPRVAHVVVHVPSDATGTDVHVSHETVPPSLFNVPYVVNPGTVVIEATAPNRVAFRRELVLREGETQTVEVALRQDPTASHAPLAAVVRPDRGAGAHNESSASGSSNTIGSQTGASHTMRPTGSYVVMAVGLGGLVGAGVLWGLRASALSGCTWGTSNQGVCDTPSRAQSAQTDGRTFNTVAPIVTIAGGVVLLGGVIWWLVGAHSVQDSQGHAGVTPWLAPNGEGAVLGATGRF